MNFTQQTAIKKSQKGNQFALVSHSYKNIIHISHLLKELIISEKLFLECFFIQYITDLQDT